LAPPLDAGLKCYNIKVITTQGKAVATSVLSSQKN